MSVTRVKTVSMWCLLLVIAIFTSCCSRVVPGHAHAGQERLACGTTTAPLLTVPRRDASEPRIAVPLPQGWVRTARGSWDGFPSVMIGNPSLASHGKVPNVLVIVDVFAPATRDAGDPEQWPIDDVVADIASVATIVEQTPGLVCGHPSLSVKYRLRGSESTALVVTSSAGDGTVWRVRLNFWSNDPRSSRWLKDTQAIVEGLIVNEIPVH